LLGIPPLRCRV